MKERKMMPLATLRGFAVCLVAWLLFQASLTPASSANTSISYTTVTIPFTADQNDDDFRPHQLVSVGIQRDEKSPATPATLAFDTGTNYSCITASLARKLKLPQLPAVINKGVSLELFGQKVVAIQVARLDIGGLHIKNFKFVVLPDQQLPGDGILGTDFCSAFSVHIDFTRSSLTFIVPANKALSYDTLSQDAVELSLADIAQQGFGTALTVPLIKYSGTFFTSVFLRNGQSIASDLLVIDSGGYYTSLSEKAIQKLNLETVAKQDAVGMASPYSEALAWLPSLNSGDLKLDNLLVRSAMEPKMLPNPNLGLDVLANHDVLLDFPHLKMYLKPRNDLQAITSRQHETASSILRRQWAQKTLIIIYPTHSRTFGIAIPYALTSDGLPLAQVRPDLMTPSVPFLLKSNTNNMVMSETLAQKWRMSAQTALDDAGKPRIQNGQIVHLTTVSNLHIAGSLAHGQIGVFPADGLLPRTSYLSLQGVVGANMLFTRPLLMDPTLQTWTQLAGLVPEDLPSLGMSDATVVDILDPDSDGIPAIAVQMQQGAAKSTETSTLATGSSFTLLSVQAAKALNLTPEPQKLRYGIGKNLTIFNQAHLSQMVIGGVVLKDVLVAYPDGAMPDGYYPRLGMNVISKLRLLVDAPTKRLYVKKAGG